MLSNNVLMKNLFPVVTALALGAGVGWTLAAQDAKPAKNWKDRAEYDLADAANKAAPKERLPLIEKWKAYTPTTEWLDEREDLTLITYIQLNDCRKAFDTSVDILKRRQNHERATVVVLGCLPAFNPPQPADYDNGERVAQHTLANLDAIYADSNKPADGQFASTKDATKATAIRTLGWIPFNKKDWPKAEAELTKAIQMDNTQSVMAYWLGSALLSQAKAAPQKQPMAIFQFARAASYAGPNAIPEAQRKQQLDYVAKIYPQYHGSSEGFNDLLNLAKNNAFPPAGWELKDANTIAREKEEEQARLDAQDPIKTLWVKMLKTPLTADDGENYFKNTVEGAGLPGGAEAGGVKVQKFKGKIVSMTPANRPKELVLGIEKADSADAILKFDDPLPGKMEPGEELEFSGTAKSYTKTPFTITFEVEPADLVGWTGKNAPGAGKAKPAAGTKPATAAKPPAATKGKAK